MSVLTPILIGLGIGSALIGACIYWAIRPAMKGKPYSIPDPIDRRDVLDRDANVNGFTFDG